MKISVIGAGAMGGATVEGLIKGQQFKNEDITVTDAEYVEKLKELAAYYSNAQKTYTPEEIEKEIGKPTITQNILMEKVDKLVIEYCTIEYKDK